MSQDSVTVWNDDGHEIKLVLEQDQVRITEILCISDPDRACKHRQADCVVEWFLMAYGLDCHVGVCPPAEKIKIAWALVGDVEELEESQVWIVSTTDSLFMSWRDTQLS